MLSFRWLLSSSNAYQAVASYYVLISWAVAIFFHFLPFFFLSFSVKKPTVRFYNSKSCLRYIQWENDFLLGSLTFPCKKNVYRDGWMHCGAVCICVHELKNSVPQWTFLFRRLYKIIANEMECGSSEVFWTQPYNWFVSSSSVSRSSYYFYGE